MDKLYDGGLEQSLSKIFLISLDTSGRSEKCVFIDTCTCSYTFSEYPFLYQSSSAVLRTTKVSAEGDAVYCDHKSSCAHQLYVRSGILTKGTTFILFRGRLVTPICRAVTLSSVTDQSYVCTEIFLVNG